MPLVMTEAAVCARSKVGGHGAARDVPTNKRQRVYNHLKAEIIEGRLRPGEPLGEAQLSTRIGLSRTPVREALQQLAIEGLVNWVPGRGTFVSAVSVPDVVELLQLREALESYAARLAARADGHASIGAFLEQLEASRGLVTSGDVKSYNRLIEALDRAVVDLANNGRLRSALQDVWTQLMRVRRMANRNPARIVATIDEHSRIVQAIEAGREDDAAAAVAYHVRASLQNTIESVAQGQRGTARW